MCLERSICMWPCVRDHAYIYIYINLDKKYGNMFTKVLSSTLRYFIIFSAAWLIKNYTIKNIILLVITSVHIASQ